MNIYCVFVSHPPPPVDEPLPQSVKTHVAKESQTPPRAVLRAAHVVALAMADVLIDEQ